MPRPDEDCDTTVETSSLYFRNLRVVCECFLKRKEVFMLPSHNDETSFCLNTLSLFWSTWTMFIRNECLKRPFTNYYHFSVLWIMLLHHLPKFTCGNTVGIFFYPFLSYLSFHFLCFRGWFYVENTVTFKCLLADTDIDYFLRLNIVSSWGHLVRNSSI